MSDKEHRLGVSEVNLVVRHLKLEPTDPQQLDAAIKDIDETYGLDAVTFDDKSYVLNLAYDASRISIDNIEVILKKHEIEVSHDWWTHFKEGYYRFVDENVKENNSHDPWSCHTHPPGSSAKK